MFSKNTAMEKPKFSLAYTSARPAEIEGTVKKWLSRADDASRVSFTVSVDLDDIAGLQAAKRAVGENRVVINLGAKNCVAGWNAAAKLLETLDLGEILIAVADDFEPPENWDTLLERCAPEGWWLRDCVVHVADGYNPDIFTLAILTARRYRRLGYLFYPDYESLFCLPPHTPILMADHTFRAIKDIAPGDKVVGSIRRVGIRGTGKQSREFLQPSKVLEVHRKRDRLVKLTLRSGKVIECTADHVWAYYGDTRTYLRDGGGKILHSQHGYPRQKGNGQFLYGTPKIGRRLVKVLETPPPPPVDVQSSRELGWLAGMYDGEGSFPVISQSFDKNPEVCKELERVLTRLGFNFTIKSYFCTWKGKRVKQHGYCIVGGRAEYLKFLSWTKPVRSFKRQVSKRMFTSRFGTSDEIVNIEDEGINDEVYCLSTETKNYVANGYLSHNSDTEHTFAAHAEKCVIQATHLTFEHRHPDCGKRGRDDVDLAHASKGRWQRGEMLFNHRRGLGFPVDTSPPPDLNEMALYVQAIQDDFCLYDVCRRIVDEGKKAGVPVARVYLMSPDEWWSGRPQTRDEYDQVLAAAGRLVGEKVQVSVVHQEVAPHRQFCRNRITVETSARNDALDRIYADGFAHVIIADGDELWMRGFYGRLVEAIRTTQAGGVYVGMVPVVGQPGYPVEGAKDRATVYVQRPCHLVDCRTVAGPRVDMPAPEVIHFTATRHSIEEVIRKHRDSGHGDDPDYQFERWIKEVLPNIKPGFQYRWNPTNIGLHMYIRGQNVWPRCRHWRVEELADLPASVLPYMSPPYSNSHAPTAADSLNSENKHEAAQDQIDQTKNKA